MRRVVRVVLSMLSAAALLTAASGTSDAAALLNGVPATIDIAFVNQFGNQFPENDPAFAPLDLTVEQNRQDFEAVVRDSGGSPCPGVEVAWAPSGASGLSVDPPVSVTDAAGVAATTLVLQGATTEVSCSISAGAGGASAQKPVKFMTIWSNQMQQRWSHPVSVERTGKRPAPILLTVLRTDQSVPSGVDPIAHNRPPLAGFTLYPRVVTEENGAIVLAPLLGSLDKSTVTTDANGQVQLVFTPAATLADGAEVAVAFLDRMGKFAPTVVEDMVQRLAIFDARAESLTDTESQGTLALYSDGHIKYKDFADNARASTATMAAIASWNAARDDNGKRHFVFEPVADPTTPAPGGISFRATYPMMPGAERDSFALVTNGDTKDVPREIIFHLEFIDPDPTYRVPSLNDKNVNRLRSFHRTPSAVEVNVTAIHELGHILGLGHHSKLGGQLSCHCLGRDGTGLKLSGEFPFWVNGVEKQSRKDELTAFLSFPTAFD